MPTMVKKRRFKSVKSRLIFLFILAALLPLLIVGIVVSRQIAITAACLVAIIPAAVFTAAAVTRPLAVITGVARKIQGGDLSARNNSQRTDEFGILGRFIDEMTDSVHSQILVRQKTSEITAVILGAKTPDDFSRNILGKLLDVTGSDCGAFFIHEKEGDRYKCLNSIGMDNHSPGSLEFKAGALEREMGASLTAREISTTRNIPGDTVFKIKTSIGTAVPGEAVALPIIVDNTAAAVIFLGSLDDYTKDSLEILNNTRLSLNTTFSNILGYIKTAELAEHLKEKNREITVINEELKQQAKVLKAQRIQLAQTDRLKSEFLSNMSHELRTPLNSILALSQLMISKGTGKNPGKEAENLEIIERNGRILLDLINDILDLSKIESGRAELNPTTFEPDEVMDISLETIRPVAESKGLKLKSNITDNPVIYSDKARVRQILSNLLSNAVKFTDKGEICVTVTASAGMVFFTVSDTGIGIDNDDLPYIFDEFRQVDGSSTRPFEGTGLGLAISQKFSRLLGGRLSVRSEPGKGSTFILELPTRSGEEAEPPATQTLKVPGTMSGAPEAGRPSAPVTGGTILVVEDYADNLFIVTAILDEEGYPYITARTGEEAVKKVEESLPGLILMDIQLPLMSGLEAMKRIRAYPGTENLPVIALTARAMEGDREALIAKGFDDYISKPIDPYRFLETIQKWLGRKE